MKSVRVFYKKRDRLKFISHLDMNRFMTRLLRRTDIPYWYTEGFNSHLYLNFALPLSLGFESDYEILDFKITEDNYPLDLIKEKLSAVSPDYVEIIKVAEPWLKTSEIAFARFLIAFSDNGALAPTLKQALESGEITTQKKNKKGVIKEVNLSEAIREFSIEEESHTTLNIVLSAGSSQNINPVLLLDAIKEKYGVSIDNYSIKRTAVYDANGNLFE